MINVQQAPYNAFGDGQSHPLSDTYSTLAAAQVVYPCAQALTDETDWAAIQTAVNSSTEASPNTIYLPAGDYQIDRPITVTSEGTWIVGDGMYTSRITVTAAAESNNLIGAVYFDGVDNGPPSGLRNVEVNGVYPPSTLGVYVQGTNVVYLDHVWVNGMTTGVYTTGSGDNIYENCYCEENINYGFQTETSAPMRFINCSTFQNHIAGFNFTTAQAASICNLTGCQSEGDFVAGVQISGYNDVVINGMSIIALPSVQQYAGEGEQWSAGISISGGNRVTITGGSILMSQLNAPSATPPSVAQGNGISITGTNVVNIANVTIDTIAANYYGIYADPTSNGVNVVGGSITNNSGTAVSLLGTNSQQTAVNTP